MIKKKYEEDKVTKKEGKRTKAKTEKQ